MDWLSNNDKFGIQNAFNVIFEKKNNNKNIYQKYNKPSGVKTL